MATEERDHGPATRVAVRNLATLKPEHQELMRTLLGDPGMASTTLETLVEHLLEEEDPKLLQVLARVRAAVPPPPRTEGTATSLRTTVGSLRPEPAPLAGARGTVGSLRR